MNRYESRHHSRQVAREGADWLLRVLFVAIYVGIVFACVQVVP